VTKYRLTLCPDCEGKGQIKVEDQLGNELGTWSCPFCKDSPKPGYILERIEKEKVVIIDNKGMRQYLK